MLLNATTRSGRTRQSDARELKAMLRLIEDIGYEVQASPSGSWTIATRDERGDRRVVGVDSAREVAAAARRLAGSLQVDRQATTIHVMA